MAGCDLKVQRDTAPSSPVLHVVTVFSHSNTKDTRTLYLDITD